MARAGWYDSPDGDGARWWSGSDWAPESHPDQAVQARSSRTALFVVAGFFCVCGTLLAGPQAFGVVMVNFDEHVVNAHAAVLGLFGFAALAWVLFLSALVLHFRPRRQSRRDWTVYLLLAAIGIEFASFAGLTEHLGLVLFS